MCCVGLEGTLVHQHPLPPATFTGTVSLSPYVYVFSSPLNVNFRSLLKVYSLCIKEELKIARGFIEFNLVIYNTTPLKEE
jgi:hypothetical protein